MRTFEWPIEDILAVHPGLYLEHHAVMAVALMSRLSESHGYVFVCCFDEEQRVIRWSYHTQEGQDDESS